MLNTLPAPATRFGMRVMWLPRGPYLTENAYWCCLRSALEDRGVVFDDSPGANLGARWLLRNRSEVQAVHLHFVQPFYHYEVIHARLRWVLRFARNLLLARMLGYRTVFTLHNLIPDYPLKPGWVDFLGHWVATNLTDRVIVHSELARNLLASRYKRRSNV